MNKKLSILLFVLFSNIACSTTSNKTVNANNNLSCQEGTTRQGFVHPSTTGDIPCPTGIQVCTAGQWQGPHIFDSCENSTKSCNGSLHGSVVNGYLNSTSPKGIPCTPATKTCNNGNWIGTEVYMSCVELP